MSDSRLLTLVATLLLIAAARSEAADPIRVARVRIPSEGLSRLFPPGTELRGYTVEEFERLVRAAERNRTRPTQSPVAVPIAAEHNARFDGGKLVGRTRFRLRRERTGSGWVPLSGWSPAVVGPRLADSPLRSDADGRPGLSIAADSPEILEVGWTVVSPPASDGKALAIEFPAIGVSRLTLDLPPGTRGLVSPGVRLSERIEREGRVIEEHSFAGGRVEVRLADPGNETRRVGELPWVSGSTRITTSRVGASLASDWRIEFPENSFGEVIFDLDDGLQLIDVTGRDVDSYRTVARDDGLSVAVRFTGGSDRVKRARLNLIGRMPLSGSWRIPAARPREGIRLGATTTVTLDAARTLRSLQLDAAARVPSRVPPSRELPTVFAFEAIESKASATATIEPAREEIVSSTIGGITLDGRVARMTARIQWSIPSGTVPDFTVESLGGWPVTRVELAGEEEPLDWREERRDAGRSLIKIAGVPLEDLGKTVAINIIASVPVDRPDVPFTLPRLRATGTVVDDETWVAITPADRAVELGPEIGPHRIMPEEVLAAAPKIAAARVEGTRATAWRWEGEAPPTSARLVSLSPPPAPTISGTAMLTSERLHLNWTIDGRVSGDTGSVVVKVEPAVASEPTWEDANAPSARLVSEPISPDERGVLGIGANQSAWRLRPKLDRDRRYAIKGRLSTPRTEETRVPLLAVVGSTPADASQVLAWPRNLTATIESEGPRPAAGVSAEPVSPDGDQLVSRGFLYRDISSRLSVRTGKASPTEDSGLIREAILTTLLDPGRIGRHRLLLQVSSLSESTLDLTFQPGTTIERVLRDGQSVEAVYEHHTLRIPLGPYGGVRSVVIDYHRDAEVFMPETPIRPDLPTCVLPWASFCWELTLPAGCEATPTAGDLTLAEVPASLGDRGKSPGALIEDARKTVDQTLGGRLLELDNERPSMVVDRLALIESGWGPRSRVRLGGAGDTLDSLGLVMLPFEGGRLLTTKRVASRLGSLDTPEWTARLRAAVRQGCDEEDRFQSVERWRGESTPRGFRSLVLEAWPWIDNDPSGWSTVRFVTSGRPNPESGARLTRTGGRPGLALILGALAFLFSSFVIRKPSRVAGVGHGLYLGFALLLWNGSAPDASRAGAALLTGSALGIALRAPRLRGIAARRGSTDRHFSARSSLRTAHLGGLLALAALSARGDAADPQGIVAVMPFDGVPGPLKPTDRVVLRLDDDRKLRAAAEETAPPTDSRVTSIAADHRIVSSNDQELVFESIHRVQLDGNVAAEWSFPAENAIDLTAWVNGVEAPVAMREDGRTAFVLLQKPGLNEIRLSRSARLAALGAERLSLPVAPCLATRLEIAPGGRLVPAFPWSGFDPKAGGVNDSVGPLTSLEFRRESAPAGGSTRPRTAESLILWDSTPAGDLARVRIRLTDGAPLDSLRIALDASASVFPDDIPGLTGVETSGPPTSPIWSARLASPIPLGRWFSFRVWLPAVNRSSPTAGETLRSFPRVVMEGIADLTGTIALRRPPEWKGRLGTADDGRGEAAFSERWGEFDDADLTLSGTTTFNGNSLVAAVLGPESLQFKASPNVDLKMRRGRAEFSIRSTLLASSGTLYSAELSLPRDVRILRVTAPGLTSWERTQRGDLLVRFDCERARRRVVRVDGLLPLIPSDKSGSRRSVMFRTPRWTGATSESVPIRVDSETKVETDPGLTPAREPGSTIDVYRLEPGVEAVKFTWAAPPATLIVSVDSTLRTIPEGVEWASTVTYDVQGDPIDSVFIKVPAAWTKGLTVTSDRTPITHTIETRNDANILAVKTAVPVPTRLVIDLKSTRVLEGSATVDFPDAAPLGQGNVVKRLTVARNSSRRLQVESSPGLVAEPAKPANGAKDEPNSVRTSYRVIAEPWSLRVRVEPEEGSREPLPAAQVRDASLLVTRSADGSTWGEGRFDVDPVSGRFLKLDFTFPADVPWAVVDGRPVPVLEGEDGLRLIAIERVTLGRVVVCWRTPPVHEGAGAIHRVPVPRVRSLTNPPLISVFGPRSGRPRPAGAHAAEMDETEWWLETAERKGKRLSGIASDLDLASTAVRDALVESLTDWLILERQARKAIREAGGPDLKERVARLDESGVTLFETLELLSVGDLTRQALAKAGEPPTDARPTENQPAADATDLIRLRRIGPSHRFRMRSQVDTDVPLLLWEEASRVPSPFAIRPSSTLCAAGGLILFPWWLRRRSSAPGRLGVLIGAAMLVGAAVIAPYLATGLVAMLALGRLAAD